MEFKVYLDNTWYPIWPVPNLVVSQGQIKPSFQDFDLKKLTCKCFILHLEKKLLSLPDFQPKLPFHVWK